MKRSDVFKSKKFLNATDLGGKPVVLEIERAPFETLKNPQGEEQQKTVLYFVGTRKALPLNMVNWDSVAEIAGGDTDDWPGARIEVYPTTTEMGGKTVDCIRISRPAELPLSGNKSRRAAKSLSGDLDDVIPF